MRNECGPDGDGGNLSSRARHALSCGDDASTDDTHCFESLRDKSNIVCTYTDGLAEDSRYRYFLKILKTDILY